ncbi:MAG: lysozyme inhibitor LprI family protein [Paracoccaceae bacterium]
MIHATSYLGGIAAIITLAIPGLDRASAQTVTADPTIVAQCLATVGADPAACIGRMTEHCQQTNPGGETMLGSRLCVIEEWHVWNGMLNDAYQRLMFSSQRDDAADGDWAKNLKPRAAALMESQRAWTAFRDAECTYVIAKWGTGSVRAIAGSACQRDLTARRFFVLQDHLRQREAGK